MKLTKQNGGLVMQNGKLSCGWCGPPGCDVPLTRVKSATRIISNSVDIEGEYDFDPYFGDSCNDRFSCKVKNYAYGFAGYSAFNGTYPAQLWDRSTNQEVTQAELDEANAVDIITALRDCKYYQRYKSWECKLAVVSVATGDKALELSQHTFPRFRHYANQCGADFHAITDCRSSEYPLANKFRVALIAEKYERTFFIDVDAWIKPDTPNIFERFAAGRFWTHPDLHHNESGLRPMMENELTAIGGVDYTSEMRPHVGCRNTGVVLMNREHAALWRPPTRPLITTHCGEQSWIEFQLLRSDFVAGDLPCNWNVQWWWDDFEDRIDDALIVHFANASHEERLERLQAYSEKCPS